MTRIALPLSLILLPILSSCQKNRDPQVYRLEKEAAASGVDGSAAGKAADPHAGMPQVAAGEKDPHAGIPGMGGDGKDPHAGIPGMGADGKDPHAGIPGMGAKTGDPHAGLSGEQLAAMGGSGGAPQITDQPPGEWKKQATTSMRQASYRVEGAEGARVDISLVILRGAAGGNLDNVNRWRRQLGLEPVDDAGLQKSAVKLSTPVGDAIMVEMEGLLATSDPKLDGRMIGVIASHQGDAWFYKMRGNTALTAQEKSRFVQWVQSVKPLAVPAGAEKNAAAPAGQVKSAVSPAQGDLTWKVPDGWVAATAANASRYATFSIGAADAATKSQAEMVVSHFAGDVGGDLANVNRWRQQVGLPAIDAAALAQQITQVTAGPKTVAVMDATGPQARVVAGWVRHGGETWFFKFTGPEPVVAAEKARFLAFLESVRFTRPE